jgi:hypothetical protein
MRSGAMVACLLMMGESLGGTLHPRLFIFYMFLFRLDFDLFFSLENVWSTMCFFLGLLGGEYPIFYFYFV